MKNCLGLQKKLNNQGFTLLELMIVIGIIVLLAATSIVVFNPGEKQKEQRDALRVSTLSQIASALELYYSENKKYPDALSELASYNFKVSLSDPSKIDACNYIYYVYTTGSYYEIYSIKESVNFTIPSGQDFITEVDYSEMQVGTTFSGCAPFDENQSSIKKIFKISGGYKDSSTTTP